MVTIDKATGNIVLICKQFHALMIAKEVGLGLNNTVNTYSDTDNTTKMR